MNDGTGREFQSMDGYDVQLFRPVLEQQRTVRSTKAERIGHGVLD